MLITHTIKIKGRVYNSAKLPLNSRVITQGNRYEACIIGTATKETVRLALQELETEEAKTAELKRELASLLSLLGLDSEEAFRAKYRNGGDSRMGTVTNVWGLLTRIRTRTSETERLRKVAPKLGDQVVVMWKSTVEAAEADLKTPKFAQHLRQAYSLEIRTDIKVETKKTKAEQAKAAS